MNQFDEQDIQLQVRVRDCYEAIQKAADILIQKGYIVQNYVKEMLEVFQTYGPYFVLAPGMAFAHSKPSASVLKTGLSILTLKDPVVFGSKQNDPVFLVCVIASKNAHEHMEQLKRIVTFLSKEQNVDLLKQASTDCDKQNIIAMLNN